MCILCEGNNLSGTQGELMTNMNGIPNPVPNTPSAHGERIAAAHKALGMTMPGPHMAPSVDYPSGSRFWQNSDKGISIVGGKED